MPQVGYSIRQGAVSVGSAGADMIIEYRKVRTSAFGNEEEARAAVYNAIPKSQIVNTKRIACCPMAVRCGSRTKFRRIHNGETMYEGWRGTTFEAWEMSSPGRTRRGWISAS